MPIATPKSIELDFSQYLQECSWRGIAFPTAVVGEKGGQKNAVHNKMDRDGAQVEGTGRAPDVFSIRGYFFNDLNAGPNESWKNSQLFPSVWFKVRDALRDRSTGVLNHPLYGNVNCKPNSWSMTVDADKRRGVIVEMEFIETIDTDGQAVQVFSVIGNAQSAAVSLDSTLTGIPAAGLSVNTGGFGSFTGWLFSITSIINQVSTLGSRIVGSLNRMIDSVESLVDQIRTDLDGGVSNVQASGFYNMLDAAQNLLNALFLMRQQLSAQQAETAILTTSASTTISAVIGLTQNKLEDLLTLNPNLALSPFIPPNSQIAYYV